MSEQKFARVGVATAVLFTVTLPAHADLIRSFKTDGSIEIKAFGIDNETDRNGTRDDYRGEVRSRILAGATFDVLDDVHGRVLLRKNNRLYGQPVENVNSIESAFALDNAYVRIDKVFGAIDLTMGRQFYSSPEDFAIGIGPYPDDLLSVGSADLFRADAGIGNVVHFQGIAGKLNETTPISQTSPAGPLDANTDTDVFGGSAETDAVGPAANLAAFYYTRKNKYQKPPAVGNDTLSITGLKLGGELIEGLNYRLDFMQNLGRNSATVGQPAYDGTAYFVGLRYGHTMGSWTTTADSEGIPLRGVLEYGRGSDNFQAIAVGPRFGKIWGETRQRRHRTVHAQSCATGRRAQQLKDDPRERRSEPH